MEEFIYIFYISFLFYSNIIGMLISVNLLNLVTPVTFHILVIKAITD